MKKNIGSHISSRLRNLSKAELDAAAKQVLIILERAVVARFISDDEKLYLELNKLFPTKMSAFVTDDLSISDIIPISDSDIPIGFYFANQINPEEHPAEKFWFTVEDLLGALYQSGVSFPEGGER